MKRYILSVLLVIAALLLTGCGAGEDLPVPPVDVPGAPYVAGTIDITDPETMEVWGVRTEGKTVAVSLDKAEELAAFFNGRELTGGESPACACDLTVETDEWKILVSTDCGTVFANADGIDGYTELTADEMAELDEILDVYGLNGNS